MQYKYTLCCYLQNCQISDLAKRILPLLLILVILLVLLSKFLLCCLEMKIWGSKSQTGS